MKCFAARSQWEMWKKQNPRGFPRGFWKKPAMTYFRVIHTIMGPKCLTAVFGMGTGVATWVWSPARRLAACGLAFACRHANAKPQTAGKYQKGNGKELRALAYAILVSSQEGISCVALLAPQDCSRRGSMRSSDW